MIHPDKGPLWRMLGIIGNFDNQNCLNIPWFLALGKGKFASNHLREHKPFAKIDLRKVARH
jgi:hypothetical protein